MQIEPQSNSQVALTGFFLSQLYSCCCCCCCCCFLGNCHKAVRCWHNYCHPSDLRWNYLFMVTVMRVFPFELGNVVIKLLSGSCPLCMVMGGGLPAYITTADFWSLSMNDHGFVNKIDLTTCSFLQFCCLLESYFKGVETTSGNLIWTLCLLSGHGYWWNSMSTV